MSRADLPSLDPDAMAARVRARLRSRIRATRSALPAVAVAERSARIVRTLESSPRLAGARSVAIYHPIVARREVDVRSLDAYLRARNKLVFYPFMDPRPSGGYVTGFRRVDSPDELSRRGQPFAEPLPTAPEAGRGDVDVVIVPALAVTPEGDRLGHGSGFYDVTLPDVRPPAVAIAVAFSFQLVHELPLEAHDVPCDVVVTDQHLFDPHGLLQTS